MFYKESKTGQVLQEGINEAGAMSDWIAAATSYSVHNVQTIPFYILLFDVRHAAHLDLCWAAGDQRARGFLIGGTAGRTTLNGEGLQHEDGHSLILANLIPNCISYDPTFQYEVAVVVQDGMRRMFQEQEDVFYYLTVMNENYEHPEMPRVPKPTSSRACTLPKGRRNGWPARAAAGLRHHLPRSHRRRRPAQERLGRRGRPLGLPELQRTGPQRSGHSALEPAAPAGSPRSCRTSSRSSQAPRVRSSPPPTTSSCSPSRSVRSSRHLRHAGHRRLRPFRHPRESCVTSSRSTVTG
jgi:hypothetical protein